MALTHHVPTLASVPVVLSSGKIIKYALIIEAILNVVGIVGLLYYAKELPALVAAPSTSNTVAQRLGFHGAVSSSYTPFTSELLAGIFAVLTVPIVLCIPDTKRAIESRPTVYATLLSGEIILCIQLALEARTGRNALDVSFCWTAIYNLLPIGLWRIWVLTFRPQWMGSYREAPTKKA